MATVFTTAGKNLTADIFDGTTATPANWYLAWGTGAGTAAVGDTTLFTEAAEARVAATEAQPSANVNRFTGDITSASAQTITNAGVLSASSSGTLIVKADFTGVVMAIGDKISFTWDITWA